MRVVITEVTPELAKEWLETKNTHNRKIFDQHVKKLVDNLKSGRWVDNGQSISFSSDGVLLDGQHRLTAIAISGVSATIPIVCDVSDKRAFATYDVDTRKRNANQIAEMLGVDKNSILITGAARIALFYENSSSADEFGLIISSFGKNHTCHSEDVAYKAVDMVEDIQIMSAAISAPLYKASGIPSAILGILYVLSTIDPYHTYSFSERVRDGFFNGPTDPAMHLRTVLLRGMNDMKGSLGFRKMSIVAMVVKAWNADKRKIPISQLKFSKREGFPSIVGGKW